MDKVPHRSCRSCKTEIQFGDDWWEPHGRGWPGGVMYCVHCVQFVAPIVHPDAPLLPPEGWGPAPMGSASSARPKPVKPASRPKGGKA